MRTEWCSLPVAGGGWAPAPLPTLQGSECPDNGGMDGIGVKS